MNPGLLVIVVVDVVLLVVALGLVGTRSGAQAQLALRAAVVLGALVVGAVALGTGLV